MAEMMEDGWYRPETIDEEREYSKAWQKTHEMNRIAQDLERAADD